MAWGIGIKSNVEAVPWSAAPSDGLLVSGESIGLVLSLDSSSLQARAAAYSTTFILNTTSPTPTPHPVSQLMQFVGLVTVSAMPSAEHSNATLLHNASELIVASSIIQFDVTPVDHTGLVILDGWDIGYVAKLRYLVDASETVCVVAYDATVDRHRGYCALPNLVLGDFTLHVTESGTAGLTVAEHPLVVTKCPPTYTRANATCTCPLGLYDTGSVCAPCPSGTIRDDTTAVICSECEYPRAPNDERTACTACVAGHFWDQDEALCAACPSGVTCGEGSSLADWELRPGLWRPNDKSQTVLVCAFGDMSCPGHSTGGCEGGDEPYCACGYRGPLCSECDSRDAKNKYFNGWTKDGCFLCESSNAHLSTVLFGGFVLFCLVGFMICVGTKIKRVKQHARYLQAKQLYKASSRRLRICFFTFQVIAEYTAVSDGTAGGRSHPEPSATFASVLRATNLDILGFVPFGCFLPASTFFTKLFIQTMTPAALIALLWLRVLVLSLGRDQDSKEQHTRKALHLTFLLLELLLPRTSSVVMKTFACVQFDNEFYLQEQLTQACDGGPRRRTWVAFATCMLFLYPIGVPLVVFCLLATRRKQIKVLMETMAAHGGSTSLAKVARRPSVIQNDPDFVVGAQRLSWLAVKCKYFRPSCWYMSVVLLLFRLAQTSLLVICPDQSVQASLATCFALMGCAVIRELSPYTSDSMNLTAVLGQALIFLWCFTIVLYHTGTLNRLPTALVGTVLVLATLAFFVHTLWSTYNEMSNRGNSAQPRTEASQGGDSEAPADAERDARGHADEAGDIELTSFEAPRKRGMLSPNDKPNAPDDASSGRGGSSSLWPSLDFSLCVATPKPQASLLVPPETLDSLAQLAREQLKEKDEAKLKILAERMLTLALSAGADSQDQDPDQG